MILDVSLVCAGDCLSTATLLHLHLYREIARPETGTILTKAQDASTDISAKDSTSILSMLTILGSKTDDATQAGCSCKTCLADEVATRGQ